MSELPIHPETKEPRPAREQPGYYLGFSTLAQQAFWDAATRETIVRRVNVIPPRRFFTEDETCLLEIVCSHLIPQDDRTPERRIPIIPFIDERLFANRTAGYRYDNMPPDGDAHRFGLQAIEQMALDTQGLPFRQLSWHQQDVLLKTIHDAQPAGAKAIWEKMPVMRYWALLLQDCLEVYYAHPWSWDEIGFGGPAYPRAYTRLEGGEPEPWEVPERRYAWQAPSSAVSDPPGGEVAAHHAHPPQGQGGSH